ncbi:cell division protein FtsI/penicillin-binding protein 2 [Clostridium pasteurianum BC1]|uniref:Cell division protein FtsI/penicillin-binding protein 2 n=2 Tax=Clostridium pasteurianum TaxID=1501 RepID=R4KCD3_CLOPA|nr:cell division protein FtsI/penicillin-binding protein 2 [Clostridium pasteurianum BC1]
MNIKSKKCLIVLIIFFSMFIFLIYKLYSIACIKNAALMTSFNAQNTSFERTTDLNYNVLDTNGEQLLKYQQEYYAVINPYIFLKNNSDTNMYNLRALTYTLRSYNKDYDLFNASIKTENQKLYWRIDEDTYNKIKNIKDVNGFYAYIYYKVDRSEAADISNIITNIKDNNNKDKDKNSLEYEIVNRLKNNSYTEKAFERDVYGNLTNIRDIKSNSSVNVKLTIDKKMNDKVNNVLNEDEFKNYNQISAIVMESDTGKIRSLTQKNLNMGNENAGIEYGYLFPGSIFKTIVEEAALESNSITTTQHFQDTGKYNQEGRTGSYTADEAYIVSSNEAFMKIGNLTGYDNIYKYAKAQGIFDKVLSLNYEQYGIPKLDPNSVGDISLMSIGQKFRITPLEALSIPNTVINNGVYVKPSIIEDYVDGNGKVVYTPDAISRNVFSTNTASIMKEEMRQVVSDKKGTAQLAYVPNNDIGGKTGTSTRIEKEKHVDGWFVGFFKIKDKYYSAVVQVPDIKTSEEAGDTAVPVFKRIVEELNK